MPKDSERDVWNRRYRDRQRVPGNEPSPFLAESLPTILQGTAGRRALDVASGEGRNSIYLARSGFETVGVDTSDVALDQARRLSRSAGLSIDFRTMDLREQFPDGVFDLVVMVNFLLKPLIPKLYDVTAPGGYILMSVMLDAATGGSSHHNPEFRVVSGELESLFSSFAGRIVTSSEHAVSGKARIVFKRSD